MSAAPNTKIWFVRVKGKSAGPFSFEEVSRAIEKGQIDGSAEVSSDKQNWMRLLLSPDFRVVLRNKKSDFEEHTRLSRGIKEQLEDRSFLPGIGTKGPEWGELVHKKPVEPLSNSNVVRAMTLREILTEKLKSLWDFLRLKYSDPELRPARLAAVGAILILTALYFVRSHLNQTREAREQKLVDLGLRLFKSGDLVGAREKLEEASELRPRDMNLKIDLSKVLIEQSERSGALKILNTVFTSDAKDPVKAESKGLIGLIELIELNPQAEATLKKALELDPSYYPAFYNLAMLRLREGKVAEAEDLLLQSAIYGGKDGSIYLALAETALAQQGTSAFKRKAETVDHLIEDYMKRSSDFRAELLVGRALLASSNGNQQGASAFLDQALTIDPYLTEEHSHDTRLLKDRAGWRYVSGWCKALQNKMQNTPRVSALIGYCLTRGGLEKEGKTLLQESWKQAPQDASVAGVLAYTFQSSSEVYSSAMKVALQSRSNILGLVLEARRCEHDKNFVCSDTAWERIHQLEPSNVSALVGVGRALLRNHKGQEAKALALEALQRSDQYQPLHRLINKILDAGISI